MGIIERITLVRDLCIAHGLDSDKVGVQWFNLSHSFTGRAQIDNDVAKILIVNTGGTTVWVGTTDKPYENGIPLSRSEKLTDVGGTLYFDDAWALPCEAFYLAVAPGTTGKAMVFKEER